jgi:hypothetical protein
MQDKYWTEGVCFKERGLDVHIYRVGIDSINIITIMLHDTADTAHVTLPTILNTVRSRLSLLPGWTSTAITGGAIVLLGVLTIVLPDARTYHVAFAGNNILATNDIPRLVERMGLGSITQQSCINPSATIDSIIQTGNGMASQWATEHAFDDGMYDVGVCTIKQLILGYDDSLSYNNENNNYQNIGTNPCFEEQDYIAYLANKISSNILPQYFVIAGNTKRMALEDYRLESINSLSNDYMPLLAETGAIPIVIANHAFLSSASNTTGLEDIATFTSMIHQGAQQYAQALSKALAKPVRVSPVGLAFLYVYERKRDLWYMLTAGDDIHASVFGSFLTACVLYATITGKMPDPIILNDVKDLFNSARSIKGDRYGYPHKDEATFLWDVAKKVGIQGVKPKSLQL